MKKTVLITGVSQGLGRMLADAFVTHEWHVIGCARNVQAIGLLAEQFPNHSWSVVDVADWPAVKQWATSETLCPDLMINNAALMNRPARLWEIGAEEFDAVVDVNIKGIANVIRAWAPRMVERGTGVIANFSSGWGTSTSPEVAPYCATKWAVEGLTQALSQELPAGMAAVAVNPGIIDTAMLQKCWGTAAHDYPVPQRWIMKAYPFLSRLDAGANGQSVEIS